jgi:hypothetical protein
MQTYVFPANLKTVEVDPSTSSPAMTTSQPPQATSRLVLLEPLTPSLSSATKSAIYSCQCGLSRHALIVDI